MEVILSNLQSLAPSTMKQGTYMKMQGLQDSTSLSQV